MANPEHIAILRQGIDPWNQWRKENPEVQPDLQDADLRGATLDEANFYRAILRRADLRDARLFQTNFQEANLNGANLSSADLHGAYLFKASLREASLARATLKRAWFWETVFANTILADAVGLEEGEYYGPSIIDHRTLAKNPHLPTAFLRGCGLSSWEIEAAKLYNPELTHAQIADIQDQVFQLRAGGVIEFHSCFISYSSKNDLFARKLYQDLQDAGVRCWFAPEDLRIGDRIRTALDEAISLQEKLLLILSKNSAQSPWVEQEVEKAFERERRESITMLFPIRLDDTVFRIDAGWASHLKNTRYVGDFTKWHDSQEYQRAFDRLLRDLKAV